MTSKLDVVPSEEWHIHELVKNLRPGELHEALIFYKSPEEALLRGFKSCHFKHTALVDGEVAAMWGLQGSLLGNVGHPFLLTGKNALKISSLAFVRLYRNQLQEMKKFFPILVNYVDAEYKEAVKLLRLSGFTLQPEKIMNKDVYKFTMVTA